MSTKLFFVLVLVTISAHTVQPHAFAEPTVVDPDLRVETMTDGLSAPTSMAFLDESNIIILEKEGTVRLVSDGILKDEPLLRLPVRTEIERGLLGIAIYNVNNVSNVLLYYTEAEPLRNRIDSFQWNGEFLINQTLIIDLPADPSFHHNGGKLKIGPDNYLYAIIGDVGRDGKLQNFGHLPVEYDTSVVLRINPNDGSPAAKNPFSGVNDIHFHKYYAYGIRNSFGIAFDPLTGNLWDTENGHNSYDEINLVKPGLNSGFDKLMGPMSRTNRTVENLVNFPDSHYSDPVLSFQTPLGLTDIEFLNSSNLGNRYTNNIFIGDINNGHLYYLELDPRREDFVVTQNNETGLADRVVDNNYELSSIIFGKGFGGITDIATGPDGSLYILSYFNGTLYKVYRPQI